MKASKLTEKLCVLAKARKPVLVKGAPGVGKSDLIALVATLIKYDLLIMHPVISSPTDFKGIGAVVQKEDGTYAEWLPLDDLWKIINAKKPTIVFFDDAGQAPTLVQAAMMQLVLARRIGLHKVSEYVTFIAATNRKEDMAGVGGMIEPLKGRFRIYEMDADVKDWIVWAYKNDMPHDLIAFIHFQNDMLFTHEPDMKRIVNGRNPRNVAAVGENVNLGLDDHDDVAASAGEAFAHHYLGFRRVWKEMPNLDKVIKDPDNAPVPDDTKIDALYAVAVGLAAKVDKKTAEPILMHYAPRLPDEYHICLVEDVKARWVDKDGKPEIEKTKTWAQWTAKYGHLFAA